MFETWEELRGHFYYHHRLLRIWAPMMGTLRVVVGLFCGTHGFRHTHTQRHVVMHAHIHAPEEPADWA